MAYGIAATALYSDGNLRHVYKGEDVTDSIGGNSLTNNNSVSFTAARYDNGFNLGTSNSTKYLNTTAFTANSNSFATAFTMSLWVKLSTEITSGTYMMGYIGINSAPCIAYEIIYDYGGGTRKVTANRRREAIANNYLDYASGSLGTSTFHHLVLTYDGTNLKLYFDNNTPSSVATSGNGNVGTETNGFIIGRERLGDVGAYVSGIIDDVALFDRALSAAEVSTLFSSPPSPAISGGDFFALL